VTERELNALRQDPQVAGLGDRLVRRLRNVVLRNLDRLTALGILRELVEQLGQCFAVGRDALQQCFELSFVRLRHCGKRIERREHLVRLGLVEVNDQNRYLGIGRGLGPQVTVDNLEPAVREFPDHQGIDVSDLGQDPAERVLLLLGMLAPVLGMGAEVASPDAAEILDPITDVHGRRAPRGSRRPTGC
jgi:hypothetical protein